MIDVQSITQDELIRRIKAKLESKPHKSSYSHLGVAPPSTEPAAFVLILGAGFSYGIVPLVKELMWEEIGGYYYPDQDMTSLKRRARVLRKHSASFWAEFNEAAVNGGLPVIQLNNEGLPVNPGAAYQSLFRYDIANVLFAQPGSKKRKLSYVERLEQQRMEQLAYVQRSAKPSNTGEKFVKGFLRYLLDPGSEHGYGSTGRNDLNSAHIYLAKLLEAQQLGRGWTTCAFCRIVFTTNFDTLLQNALQKVNLLYRITDRPESGFHESDFLVEEGSIHLVYTHGSILRHNPASTLGELNGLANKNIHVLRDTLKSRDVIAIGYSGWNDGLMAALCSCKSSKHNVYWCGVDLQPEEHVASCLSDRAGDAAYVQLGKEGANGFMRALYEALIPTEAQQDPGLVTGH